MLLVSSDPLSFVEYLVTGEGVMQGHFPLGVWSPVVTSGVSLPKLCLMTAVLYLDRYIIVFGGASDNIVSNVSFMLDLQTGEWVVLATKNTDLVRPRACHSAVIYKNKMIVFGGVDMANPTVFNDVLQLNLDTLEWSAVNTAPSEPSGPGPRNYHSAHVYEGRMYVVMGESRASHPRGSKLWYLDLETYIWHAEMPEYDRDAFPPAVHVSGHAAAVHGDCLYVFGGMLGNQTATRPRYTNTLHEYCFTTRIWRELAVNSAPPRPAQRYACAMAIRNKKVLIFGGDAVGTSPTCYFGDTWTLDAREGTRARWELADSVMTPTGPGRRSGFAYVVAQSALYVLGGELFDEDGAVSYSNELFCLPLAQSISLSLTENVKRWLSHGARRGERYRVGLLPSDLSGNFRLGSYLNCLNKDWL